MKKYKYSFTIATKSYYSISEQDKILRSIEKSFMLAKDSNLGLNISNISAFTSINKKINVSMTLKKNTPDSILDQSINDQITKLIKKKGYTFELLKTNSGREFKLSSIKKDSEISSSSSLRTMSNLYSIYSCGEKVMAQRYRMSNPSITTYCPGIIKRIISNFYYEIQFNDKSTQILKKNYFFVNNPSNKLEQYNYLSKLNELYGIGTTVTVNKNYNKYLPEVYVSAVISDGSYEEGSFTLDLKDGTALKNVPLEEVYTVCDNVTQSVESEDTLEEEQMSIKKQPVCKNPVVFSSELFIMQNKYILGLLMVILTIISFLIII